MLLDPKNDYIFKRLFATAPDLLSTLINAVRYEEKPVEVIEVLNPRIDPAELTGKFIVLDVLAKDQQGQLFNIEMQVRHFHAWSQRGMYYLANTLVKHLGSGDNYLELKPVIGIHLLCFDLFTAPEQSQQAHWCFEMRDRWQPATRLGAELQLHIVELDKADRLQTASSTPGLAAWIAFFEHWSEESTMNQLSYPPVQEALRRLKDLSADDETQQRALMRERALRDEVTELFAAEQRGEQRGRQEGRQEGEQIGEQRGLEQALAKMLQNGMSEAQARSILGL